MPWALPVCIRELIIPIFPSRIRFAIAGTAIKISFAAQRPLPSAVLSSCWATTARSESASITRTWGCSSEGKASMMRSIVLEAELVCSVPNTRMPSSAAASACRIVSRSRISPTSTMSGSSREAIRSALAKERVWAPTSRCVIRHFLFG